MAGQRIGYVRVSTVEQNAGVNSTGWSWTAPSRIEHRAGMRTVPSCRA
jgi:DNA invertase Pin-like site-specific DNA recombinase